MPPLDGVNWIAVLVAAVVYFILGALWYGPLLGKTWVAGMSLDPSTMQANPADYAISFVANLGLNVALAALLAAGNVAGPVGAMTAAFWLWLGIVFTSFTINAVWDTRPKSVFGVNVGYHLVGMLLAGLIMGAWPA